MRTKVVSISWLAALGAAVWVNMASAAESTPAAPEPAGAVSVTGFEASAVGGAATASMTPSLALTGITAAPVTATPVIANGSGTTFESVRWRPRRGRYREPERDYESVGRRGSGFTQIHGGFLDPDGDAESGFLGGLRMAAGPDPNVRVGFGIDWVHKGDRTTVVVSQEPLPGGGTSERRLELARSSSNLFPLMALLQISPDVGRGVQPYFGIGGGYQVLFLSADDFEAGTEFDATYGGWGWQAWGGIALPLSGDARFIAEVYRNDAEVERDVDDAASGQTFREIVDVGGAGMRFGLSWGF